MYKIDIAPFPVHYLCSQL